MLAKEPGLAAVRTNLVMLRAARAQVYNAMKRHGDALADWDRAIELANESMRDRCRQFRAIDLLGIGDHARAVAEAAALAERPSVGAMDLYSLACVAAMAVAVRVLNAVNREQAAKASFVVRDSNGMQVGSPSTPVDVMLTVQASLVNVDLGSIDTTGFANGNYSVEVTLSDMNDQPIPGATGSGNFLVGSPVTALLDVSPDVLPPGTSTVTNTLTIDGDVPSGDPLTLLGTQTVAGARSVAARNDVAYVCGSNGISVIDYSDPENLSLQGTVSTGAYAGCRIQDNLLLAARGTFRAPFTLDVFSLQGDPLNPVLLGRTPTINYNNLASGLDSTSTRAFVTQMQICFFLGSNDIFVHMGELFSIALNLDNPVNPTSATPTLDSVLFNTFGDSSPDPSDVAGCAQNGGDHNVFGLARPNPQTVYLAASSVVGGNTQAGVGRVEVVDVTDPRNPSVVRRLDIPGTVHSLAIGLAGNTGVVIGSTTGWNDPIDGLRNGRLTVTTLDLTDPLDPQIVTTRILDRTSRTFWTNLARLDNGLFAFSSIDAQGNDLNPAILLIDASNPLNPQALSTTDVAQDSIGPNAIASDGDLLLVADTAGLSIYEIGDIPVIPVTVQVQVPNNAGVAIVPNSFNVAPTEIIVGPDFDTLRWETSLSAGNTARTFTWQSTVSGLDAGSSLAVTLDTTVDFTSQGTPGQVNLPTQEVVAEHVISIDPASQTVRPGEAAMINVTLRNPTAAFVSYDLAVSGVPQEWVSFTDPGSIFPNSSIDVAITIQPDPFATLSDFDFVVTATSPAGINDSVNARLTTAGDPVLPEADADAHGIVVSVSPTAADAGQGTAAAFIARVTNTGSATEMFDLAALLPAGFVASFEITSIDLLPGAGNFRDVRFTVTPPLGTVPDSYSFTVTATSTADPLTTSMADANVNVLAAGVVLVITPGVFSPGPFQLFVANTGQFADTFDLTLGGPAALVGTLSVNSVTLDAGAFQFIDASIGAIDFATAGDLQLSATATSRSSPTVQATAIARVEIAPSVGLTSAFDPGQVNLPQPGVATFLLLVENTGNTEDVYTARIMTTSGPIVANLIGLDGQPTQTIPVFRLPSLATGAILLNATLMAFGQGEVTVEIRSQANRGVVASATATVMSKIEVQACATAPGGRALVDAGNVSAAVVNGRLMIRGDELTSDIRIEAGPNANSLCITGNDGTTVNGQAGSQLFEGVNGLVSIIMRGGRDSVAFDGTTRPISLASDLRIRMNSIADTVRLDHVSVAGRTRIGTGRGHDLVELIDTVLAGGASIGTGRGNDRIVVRNSQFLADVVFDGVSGLDSIDAGLRRRPNSIGNLFAREIDVKNIDTLLS